MRAFEALGRLNLGGGMTPTGTPGPVGTALDELDCEGDLEWHRFTAPQALFEAWGPPATSPWSGYHRPTLFAASGPAVRPKVAALLASRSGRDKARVPSDRAIILDLPGAASVAVGGWLAKAGFQPVVLANNWPHSNDVVDLGAMLGALLYYAPWALTDKDLRGDKAPPVFILDRGRLGRAPRPGEFDNRYYHTDADLPSPATLRRNGIRGVLYIHPPAGFPTSTPPVSPTLAPLGTTAEFPGSTPTNLVSQPPPDPNAPVDLDDVHPWLREAQKQLGLVEAAEWAVGDFRWRPPSGLDPRPRKTVFNTVKDPAFQGFRRAAAGGFGRIVPEPSQGGGYAGGAFG
ncbi:MAG: hypothetical protein AABY18_03780 [Candidatus Thermoplasmatota archaeon]